MFDVFKTAEFKRALTFYVQEVKNNRKHFLISMSSAVIWCFLVVLHPYLIKRIVDDGIVANNRQIIVVFISFLIVIGYIRAASIGIRRYFSMSVSFNVEAEIRNSIFGHMQKLAFKYHDKVPTGELMARASSDASQVRLAFAIAPLATANVFLLLILSITLVSISFTLGVIVLLSIPLVLWLAGIFASKAMEISLRVKEAEAEMTTEVEEQLGGIRVVKAFGNENEASEKVESSIGKIYDTSIDFLHLRTRFVPMFELIPMIITLVVLLLGGYLALNDLITLGDFIAFTLYVILLIWPLRITAWFLSEIPSSVSAGNRILQLLDAQPSIFDYENNRNYRFLLSQDNLIEMYDSRGKIVSGFNPDELNADILNPPVHIRIKGKDYILLQLKNGELKILNRRGKERISVNKNIDFSNNNFFSFMDLFTTTDINGNLIQIDMNGNIVQNSYNLEDNNTIEVIMDNILIHSGNSMNINGKIINLPQGRYTKPKLFNYKDLLYISITDEKENKIYLFNNEGDMVNGFPLKGTNIVDIVDSDNDGKIELISQLDNNSVISYEIN